MRRDPWQEYKDFDPHKQQEDFNRMRGHQRHEILVPVKSIVSFFKRLFG